MNFFWAKMVSNFLPFQSHPRLSDLYIHNKANGRTKTNISWLTGEISFISDHQMAHVVS